MDAWTRPVHFEDGLAYAVRNEHGRAEHGRLYHLHAEERMTSRKF